MSESEELYIIRAQAGDSACFGHLYDRYIAQIHRFIALKVGTRQEAEDLTHEVFVSAWQKLPNYKPQGYPFSSWLYRIARNRVIDYYRTKKPQVSIDEQIAIDEAGLGIEGDTSDEFDKGLSMASIQRALAQLSGDQREVMQLRFLDDLSPAEIAQVMGKREGAVRILQHRAIQKLKTILEPENQN